MNTRPKRFRARSASALSLTDKIELVINGKHLVFSMRDELKIKGDESDFDQVERFAFWRRIRSIKLDQLREAESDERRIRGETRTSLYDQIANSDLPLTEASVEAQMAQQPHIWEIEERIRDLRSEYDRAATMCEALEHRRSVLMKVSRHE